PPPTSSLFPYTTLFRSLVPRCLVLVDDILVGDSIHDSRGLAESLPRGGLVACGDRLGDAFDRAGQRRAQAGVVLAPFLGLARRLDRKSTRLNSSHVSIS